MKVLDLISKGLIGLGYSPVLEEDMLSVALPGDLTVSLSTDVIDDADPPVEGDVAIWEKGNVGYTPTSREDARLHAIRLFAEGLQSLGRDDISCIVDNDNKDGELFVDLLSDEESYIIRSDDIECSGYEDE